MKNREKREAMSGDGKKKKVEIKRTTKEEEEREI